MTYYVLDHNFTHRLDCRPSQGLIGVNHFLTSILCKSIFVYYHPFYTLEKYVFVYYHPKPADRFFAC